MAMTTDANERERHADALAAAGDLVGARAVLTALRAQPAWYGVEAAVLTLASGIGARVLPGGSVIDLAGHLAWLVAAGEWQFDDDTIAAVLPIAYAQLAAEGKVPRTTLKLLH